MPVLHITNGFNRGRLEKTDRILSLLPEELLPLFVPDDPGTVLGDLLVMLPAEREQVADDEAVAGAEADPGVRACGE